MTQKALPPLKTLPAFTAVAKHLSFSKAAKELFVTHSAVSQCIKTLETFLGHKLFTRQAGKVTLTEDGQKYYAAINNALNIIDNATQQQLGPSASNVLTVNIMTTLTMRWLIPKLPSFQARYPKIDLRLSALDREINFAEDNIDLAIVYAYGDEWPTYYCEKLISDKLVLVGSPKLVTKKQKIATLLKKYKAIYVTTSLRKFDWQQWCKTANTKEPCKKDRIYFQNSPQALQAAVNGLGILVSHEPFIIEDLKSGQLIKLAEISVPLTKAYFLVCPHKNLQYKKIAHFCNWITKEAKPLQLKNKQK